MDDPSTYAGDLLDRAIVRDLLIVPPELPLADAIAQLGAALGSAPADLQAPHAAIRASYLLVAVAGRPLGMLTAQDALRLATSGRPLAGLSAGQAMGEPPPSVRRAQLPGPAAALARLLKLGGRPLLVLDASDRALGMLTYAGLLQLWEHEPRLADELELRQLNQELEARVAQRTAELRASTIALRRSEAHLLAAQRISQLGSWEFDTCTGEIVWSAEVYRLFGRDPQRGVPRFAELGSYYTPASSELHNAAFAQAIATGQPYDIELTIICDDGTTRIAQARGEPVFDHDHTMLRLVGTILDITERKQAEERYRNLSDRLALAVRSAAMGIWDWDIPANTLTWDARMYELYGVEPGAFSGTYAAWDNGLHPDDRVATETAIQRTLRGESLFDITFRVRRPGGEVRWIEAHGLVRYNDAGEPLRMIGVNIDITQRRLAEEQLRAATLQLQLANRELESFAYSVSHDLRAPLRAIDGFSKALLEDYADRFDAQGQDYFRRIRGGAQRMSMLIDDLLRLSQVSRADMDYSWVDLSALVRQIVAELREAQPERQLTLVVVPEALVYADRNLIQVALANLLQNAWKFTSHHPTARIEFGVLPQADGVAYYVRDDGAGFNMDYADKLFGVFQRLHGSNEFPGTGIGLATVQRVIFRHGGQVWAEGAVERGATIFFTCPLRADEGYDHA